MTTAATTTSWTPVARVGDLAAGDVLAVEVAGQAIVLGRDGDRYFATQRRCLHQGGDLALGIVSRGHLVCPHHGWRFSTATGAFAESAETCLAMFAVRVVDGAIEVEATPHRHHAP